MSKTLNEQAKTVDVAEIVRHGERLTLPDGMKIAAAIDLLQRRAKYEQTETAFSEKFDVLPFDGANALNEVLLKKFGWAEATGTPGFFGTRPPQLINIEVAPGVFKQVPWGRINLPNLEAGFIETGVQVKDGRYVFSLNATILRVDEETVKSLFAEVREYLKTGSIYKGRAIKIRFLDEDGDALAMPEPAFIDTRKIDPAGLIYADDVTQAIETNLFTPISRVADCIANGIPVKRGVLLGGTYGTGKTLAATVAARLATDEGVTYVYIPRADELSHAIEFAKQYQSPACVIFCEDVDRVTDGERSVEMDDILNILDGIDTKNANIITVVTTNDLQSINPAMLRPGRLDAVIDVTPPDAKAVEKLLRLYGGASIAEGTDLTKVGELLAGNIPAVIAEVVKRAKLAQLRLQPRGVPVTGISEQAFIDASTTMNAQVQLLRDRSAKAAPALTIDAVLGTTLAVALEPVLSQIEDLAGKVRKIEDEVC